LLAIAAPTWADEYPDFGCQSLEAGASCLTADGATGTCVRKTARVVGADGVSRLELSYECVGNAEGALKRLLPWLGVGLAFLAACAAMTGRRWAPRRTALQSRA
jgi:hypothetical protein